MNVNGIPNPFADIPAAAPPPGQQSNFTNPKTLGSAILGINITFISLMTIVVVIRVFSRACLVKSMGWDDITCIIAACGSIVHTVIVIYDIHLGFGTHLWDIRAITLTTKALREISSLAIIYPVVIFFVKLSISLLYLRLFSINKTFRYLVYFGIAFSWVFYTGLFGYQIAATLICSNPTTKDPVCTNIQKITLAAGVFNFLTDLWLLLIPIPLILKLQLRKNQRIGVLVVFLIGGSACLVSFARLIYISVLLANASQDLLYNAALTTLLTGIELNIGIIAACTTTFPLAFTTGRVFLSSFRTRLFSSRSASNLSSGKPNNPNRSNPSNDRYIELHDYSKSNEIKVVGRNPSEEADANSSTGIVRTIGYNVTPAQEG